MEHYGNEAKCNRCRHKWIELHSIGILDKCPRCLAEKITRKKLYKKKVYHTY